MMNVRTRFAPSPTGYLHIGGARTALFCWLYARHFDGQFVLRVEDTDRERSTQEAVEAILDGMRWLGLDWDEGPVFQTQRMAHYRKGIRQLLEQGDAYYCYCTRTELAAMREEQQFRGEKPHYDGRCRERSKPRPGVEPVVRFKTPQDGSTVVDDLVRGRVIFNNEELDDLIIARSDGSPTYNFTVVVDDSDLGISHVIRGDDHLNNTPRQIHIFHALGYQAPQFAHLPMILGPDGAKLSKRHGAVSVMQYREDGYLPEAVVNYLVRLGWSHGDQEIFTPEEMVRYFDIRDVNHSASAINPSKLTWLNQHYINHPSRTELVDELVWHLRQLGIRVSKASDGAMVKSVIQAQRSRSKTMREMAQSSRFFFVDFAQYDEKGARKHLGPASAPILGEVIQRLASLTEWEVGAIHDVVAAVAESHDLKLGKVAQPIRVAVSGGTISPPIDQTLAILGRQRTLERLEKARAFAAGSGHAAGDVIKD